MLVGIGQKNQNKLEGIAEGAFKGLVSLLPPVFGIALGAWDGYSNARWVEFIEELTYKVSRIEEKKIDFEYIKSEEFYDLFQKSCKVRLQHRSKLKAKFILDMITESISKDCDLRFNTNLKERFLVLIDDMSDVELLVFSDFAKHEYAQKSRADVYNEKDKPTTIALDELYAKEMLKDADTWDKHIELSALGKEFFEYISILSNQDLSKATT